MLMIPFSLKYHVHIFTKIWFITLLFWNTGITHTYKRILFSDTFDSEFTGCMIDIRVFLYRFIFVATRALGSLLFISISFLFCFRSWSGSVF